LSDESKGGKKKKGGEEVADCRRQSSLSSWSTGGKGKLLREEKEGIENEKEDNRATDYPSRPVQGKGRKGDPGMRRGLPTA